MTVCRFKAKVVSEWSLTSQPLSLDSAVGDTLRPSLDIILYYLVFPVRNLLRRDSHTRRVTHSCAISTPSLPILRRSGVHSKLLLECRLHTVELCLSHSALSPAGIEHGPGTLFLLPNTLSVLGSQEVLMLNLSPVKFEHFSIECPFICTQ